jgi:hypothetical protein
MKNWILIVIMLTLQLALFAHKDTPIKLSKEGKLIGLPEKYSNAEFDRATFTLAINDKKIIIPECIKDFFKNYKEYDITFSASWYHDPGLIPYYIHMDIVTSENPYGCGVLFNLETLEIFQITKPEVKINERGQNMYLLNEQKISKECRKSILESITKR